MLFDAAKWLADFMDLTEMSLDFEFLLLGLAVLGFIIAYVAERSLLPMLAKQIRRLKDVVLKSSQKRRKRYKVVLQEMEN